MSEPAAAIRAEVAVACRVVGEEGLGDLVWGHASARDPDGRGVWMKAAGWGFEEVTEDRTVLVSFDGDVLAGEGRRHIEAFIHTEVVAARPDVGAVVHAHSPCAVALAATGEPLRPISHEATFFGTSGVGCFSETGDLITTPELGRAVADALGGRLGLILERHGTVTVGPDLPTAVLGTILLERACRNQLRAMAAGASLQWSSEAEVHAKQANCYGPAQIADAWAYLARAESAGRADGVI